MTTCLCDIKDELEKLIEYTWKDEYRDFMETFEVHIQSQDEIMPWIVICDSTEGERGEQMRNHIFYSLMKLRLALS